MVQLRVRLLPDSGKVRNSSPPTGSLLSSEGTGKELGKNTGNSFWMELQPNLRGSVLLVGQCLLGHEPFLERLVPYLEEQSALAEIPRIQRLAARPPLARLLPKGRSKSERDRAITEAHISYGYSQQEIAAYVGLHYSTVSRIVQRERKDSKSKT